MINRADADAYVSCSWLTNHYREGIPWLHGMIVHVLVYIVYFYHHLIFSALVGNYDYTLVLTAVLNADHTSTCMHFVSSSFHFHPST